MEVDFDESLEIEVDDFKPVEIPVGIAAARVRRVKRQAVKRLVRKAMSFILIIGLVMLGM